MSAKKKFDVLPRYLSHSLARELADEIECAIAKVRDDFQKKHSAELRGLEHEISLALARAAVRYGVDLLPAAAATAIDRLEVAVAELDAELEQRKIADRAARDVPGSMPDPELAARLERSELRPNGKHVLGCRCEVCR